jgi:hypothetical protein
MSIMHYRWACDHVNGTLRGGCSLHNQSTILLQGADPMLEIGGSVPFGLLSLKARCRAALNSRKMRCQIQILHPNCGI